VKDAYHIVLVSFVALLSALSWNFEVIMVSPLVVSVLVIFICLYRLAPYYGKEMLEGERGESRINFIAHSLAFFGISLVVVLILFFMIPRRTFGYFGGFGMLKKEYLAGFSDEINIGEIAMIKANTEVAFRAKLSDRLEESKMYWRGVALDKFDGNRWRNTSQVGYAKIKKGEINFFNYKRGLIEQKIYTAGVESKYLFHLFPIAGIKIDQPYIAIDENDNFMSFASTYSMYSVNGGQSLNFNLRAIDRDRFLQLPEVNKKIILLNSSIVSADLNDYQKAIKLMNYLRSQYKYKVVSEAMYSDDPLSDFLLFRKEGHCEYFASALCVLLRLNKIPCRVVNGYLGGDYNIFGNYYIIRQSNAHSWVEAYFPDKGWVLLDATPAGSVSISYAISNWYDSFVDGIAFGWENYILLYSREKQSAIYTSINDYKSKVLYYSKNIFNVFILKVFIFISLFVFVIYLFIRYVRVYRRENEFAKQSDYLFYRLFLIKMRLLGYKKNISMTPLEFCQLLEGSAYQEEAERITKRYCYIKYSRVSRRQEP
jgi:hypothetical protein